jgi:hypothetical protein
MERMKETTMTLASINRVVRSATAVAALLLCLVAAPAEAQLARTFVSNAAGNDLNDCNRFTPCRSFQRAHDNTLPLGEITVLDPGGYGAVTITKAISIINDGVGEAGALVSGGATGITVSTGANDAVSLRGLTVKGIGFGGGNGIVFNSGGSLTVENCAIRTLDGTGFGFGILFQPISFSHLAVLNTIVSDTRATGINIQPKGDGNVTASLSRVRVINSALGSGINVTSGQSGSTATINVAVEDSVAARNAATGFRVDSLGPQAILTVTRSISAHNATGGTATNAGATLRLGESTLTGNTALSWAAQTGGVVQSYGDNNIDGNGDTDPAPPPVALK